MTEITQVFIDQELDNGSLIKAKKTFHLYLLSNVVDELKLNDFPKCIIAVHLKDKFYSKDLNQILKVWSSDRYNYFAI